MWVQVRYFAAVREIIGDTAARWELPEGATVGDLWERLATANPLLRRLTCTAAVNQEYVSPETVLADGDEVVFIPPVSGGAPHPRTRLSWHRSPLRRDAAPGGCTDGALPDHS